MSNIFRPRPSVPHRAQPMRSATELSEALLDRQSGASLGVYETRQRTQLIVDGFANLALLAILFSGVQAQFVSSTSSNNSNLAAVATNAVLFGGLMLSVCSALLATLSGRWFSILREDDSEFLSSYWLAAEARDKPLPIEQYLRTQRDTWRAKLPTQLQPPVSPIARFSGDSGAIFTAPPGDIEMEAGMAKSSFNNSPTPKEQDVLFVIRLLEEELAQETTVREKIMSKVLLSAVAVCCLAYALFCVGIMLLVWNTQPFSVAIFTTLLVALVVMMMPGFFLKHRHKRVISELALGRAAL